MDSGNDNTPWAVAMSAGLSPLPRVLRILMAATFSTHAPSLGSTSPSTVPVPAPLPVSAAVGIGEHHSTFVWAGVYEKKDQFHHSLRAIRDYPSFENALRGVSGLVQLAFSDGDL